jgi:hypothetical protein
MLDYYDRNGKPISLDEWSQAYEDPALRRVGLTECGEGVTVSTVWLGLDHNLSGKGPPLIFETMIFGAQGYRDEQWRYATEQEARTGHDFVVALVLSDERRLREKG